MEYFSGFTAFDFINPTEMSYSYYTSSSEYDEDEDDGNYLIDCRFGDCQVLMKNYNQHLEKVHKCKYCSNYMPKESIESHIERKHTVQCPHCSAELLEHLMPQHKASHFIKCEHCQCLLLKQNLNQHLAEIHPFRATIGMIRLDKFSNEEFNRLIDQKRIYAKDGHLFVK